CGNALNALEVDRSKLPEQVRIVPSGVVEIIRKQAEGYYYIRP
ncbi:MAG: hypothetical protein GX681_08290, partial [Clostridiaceae bacterium]|nr:hypothetical protein [Clostridiaceae bacterium]